MQFVLDIETVPLEQLPPGSEKYLKSRKKKETPEVEQAPEDVIKACSLDADLGRIACIGLIVLNTVGSPKSKHSFINVDEKQLLTDFWKFIKEQKGGFSTVTFNGLGFDLPWLIRRSIAHKIKMPVVINLRKYAYSPNFDCMQALSFWGAMKYKSLGFYSEALGVGQADGESASVYTWWQEKNFDKIVEHCLQDCMLTFKIFNQIKEYYLTDSAVKRGAYSEKG